MSHHRCSHSRLPQGATFLPSSVSQMARDELCNALHLYSLLLLRFRALSIGASLISPAPPPPAVPAPLGVPVAAEQPDELELLVRDLGQQLRSSTWIEDEIARKRASGEPLVRLFDVGSEDPAGGAAALAQPLPPPKQASSKPPRWAEVRIEEPTAAPSGAPSAPGAAGSQQSPSCCCQIT